ncbi:MAG TPA: pyridoxamine 5'-phosphate oxidase family protein [Alphaproteobacteria bacterium]|nr:pyridoxamine 5'-phosphate oxidase family protein [Alphaproteobacteria bacterium]
MTTPPAPAPLKLTDTMKEAVNGALGRGKPVAVSYVDESGQPHLSYRGTVQAYSDTQLALWTRDPKNGMASAIAANPAMVLLYGDLNPENRVLLTFRGRGHIDNDEAVRRKVFESSHPAEQERDKERKGVAIIIDLDSVEGLVDGGFVRQRRT